MKIALKSAVAACGGGIVYWLGGLDEVLTFLIVLIVIDYISGLLKAYHNKELDSKIGFKGIVKKVFLLCVVAVAYVIQRATNNSVPIREIAILFFIANEGLSILENAAKIGIPLPDKLVEVLLQLKGEQKDE